METRQSGKLNHAITAENYQEIGSSFIRNNGGALISLADGFAGGVEYHASPREWGAWHAYLKERGIKTSFMKAQGQAGKCWTVPARWPHEFDSEATVQGDHAAADAFMRNYRPPKQEYADAAKRLAQVNKFRFERDEQHDRAI